MNALANPLISLVWTVVFVGPLYVFCARYVSTVSLYVFLAVALLAIALPKSLLRWMALSTNTEAYRRMRVPMLIAFTQDAAWLRRFSGSPQPRVRRNTHTLAKLIRDTWTRERFHVSLLVLYTLCIGIALIHTQFAWACTLIACNVIYNLYPIWLQQYLRLRISRCHSRSQEMRLS